jgi:hypothetical protein
MNYIDQLTNEEISLLDTKIEQSDSIYKDISSLFKDTNSISNSLALANNFINHKDYANAYRCFLHSLNYLVSINEQIMEKYFFLQNTISESNDTKKF